MLIVYRDHLPTTGRFENWTELLGKWAAKLGVGGECSYYEVRKGIGGKVLVAGVKATVFAFARDQAEAEADTGYYRSVGAERQRARSRYYQREPKAFRALFA